MLIVNNLVRVNSYKQLSDTELISRYKETGNSSFVGEIFERYTRFVFCVCMKYLKNKDNSKDAVMQIFEKLLDDLKKHNIEKFKPWLHSVTKNHCLLQIRSEKYLLKNQDEFKKDYPVVMELSNNLYLDIEDDKETKLRYLEEGINQLSIEQKKCIELFYIKEKCYNEVAEITGYTMNNVKSYIQNGKRNLKNYILSKNE